MIEFKVADKYVFQVQDYTVQEDATPRSAGDTVGGTGTVDITIPEPDPDLIRTQDTGNKWLLTYGRNILLGKPYVLRTRWGWIDGTIQSAQRSEFGSLRITGYTSLNKLNAFNVTAQPFIGNLGDLLRYYCSLGGTPDPVINPALESRYVAVPGWTGELWYYIKMLGVAQEFQTSLVSGVPTFDMHRQRELVKGREIQQTGDAPVSNLARAVECYQYNNRAMVNELVYPPGGWTPEVEVLNVNAGEVVEYTLELSASVSSIQQPVMLENVGPDYSSSSVFTVVANDGLPVTPEMWDARGGSLRISINPDTTSLNIRIRGADRIPTANGWATNFSIALGSDATGSRYSTLRIIGSGVAFKKQKKVFRTGLSKSETGTEIGVTIDNPFLGTKQQCYRAGIRAAVDAAGPVPTMSATMSKGFRTGEGFGLVPGSSVFDRATMRPYRARSATFTEDQVSVDFEDDLTHDEQEAKRTNATYAEVESYRSGMTYLDDFLIGVR